MSKDNFLAKFHPLLEEILKGNLLKYHHVSFHNMLCFSGVSKHGIQLTRVQQLQILEPIFSKEIAEVLTDNDFIQKFLIISNEAL